MTPKKKNQKKKDDDIKEVDVDAILAGNLDEIDVGGRRSKKSGKAAANEPAEEEEETDLGKKNQKKKNEFVEEEKDLKVEDDDDADFGKKKKKKKSDFVIPEEAEPAKEEDDDADFGKKKKKKKSDFVIPEETEPAEEEDDDADFGKKKKKKKNDFVIREETEPAEEENDNADFGKKKKKKNDFVIPEEAELVKDDDGADFGQKKKKKKNDFVVPEEVEPAEEDDDADFGKKKRKKKSDFVIPEKAEPVEDDEDFGKKKKKKGDFAVPEDTAPVDVDEEDVDFGKKKKKKKGDFVVPEEVVPADENEADFGKKKKKKKDDFAVPDEMAPAQEEVKEPAGGIVVGQIIELRKIPKKQSYSICQVRVSTDRVVQIVTSVPVELNSKVAVAIAPCVVPAFGEEITARKVQKENSDGMFLGPNELGWGADSGFPDDVPVRLDKVEVGAPVPSLAEVKGEDEASKLAAGNKGKKGKNKKQEDDAQDLDALLGEFGVNVSEAPPPPAKGKKGKKAAAKEPDAADGEDLNALLGEFGVNVSEAPPLAAKGKKGKKAAAKPEDADGDDLDALLGEFGVNVTEAPAKGKKGKNKAAAKEPAPADGEDLDALLGELGMKVTEAPKPLATPLEEASGDEGPVDGDEQNLTAKQRANKKKAEKRKAAKAAAKAEGAAGGDEDAAAAAPKTAKDKGRQGLAAKAQERMRAMQELEEEKRKHEEEQRRIQEEHERLIAEEEAAREKKRLERKRKEAEKKERLAAQGLLLSKAERERRAAAARYREQLEAMGVVAGDAAAADERPMIEVRVTAENKQVIQASLKKQKNQWVAGDTNIEGIEKWSVLDVEPTWTCDNLEVDTPIYFFAPKKRAVYDRKKKQPAPGPAQKTREAVEEAVPASSSDAAAPAVEEAADESPAKRSSQASAVSDWEHISLPSVRAEVLTKGGSSGSESGSGSDDDSRSESGSSSSSSSSSSSDDFLGLRSPICCIMGHVDTGKTKLLDKIRHTNVQEGEAGGITQQIGATFFPEEALVEQSTKVDPDYDVDVPGLLIIDTPGHESFNNLRKRGSSLADIAILVVDIMHGLEPQTIESLEMLRKRKCPFIIALNKVDRLYDWKSGDYIPVREALSKQKDYVQNEFDKRVRDTILQLTERGLNCALYWENDDIRRNVSVVPTSAMTGEGVPDLLHLILKITQDVMYAKLERKDELECTVLEVKNLEGLGTTCDVILVNGELKENDQIVLCGLNGPIVTHVRALLTPEPLKEMRVKGDYVKHKQIDQSMGIKIVAHGLSDAVAGTQLHVVGPDDDLEEIKEEVMEDFEDILEGFDKQTEGVYVMASTLGSLEALLSFLKDSKIPVFGVNIGVVQKLDVKKAGLMLEKKHPEYAVVLAFDVKVNPDAKVLADKEGIKIMTADIIYHLFDQFTEYMKEIQATKQKDSQKLAVFPVVLKIVPTFVFNKRDPIVVGVDILDGQLRIGTPLCVPEKGFLEIGRIQSIELNRKPVESAKKGQSVCIKIQPNTSQQHIQLGRHFEASDQLYSKISRESINCLKEYFREQMSKTDWQLIIDMKKLFDIQ